MNNLSITYIIKITTANDVMYYNEFNDFTVDAEQATQFQARIFANLHANALRMQHDNVTVISYAPAL